MAYEPQTQTLEMAQQVKAGSIEVDDLNLTLGTHMVGGEKGATSCPVAYTSVL